MTTLLSTQNFNIVLQSPSYDGSAGNGDQLPLPTGQGTHAGQGLVQLFTFFADTTFKVDLGKLKEGIQLQGVFTDQVAAESFVRDGGSAYQSALAMRDALRRTRTSWAQESAPATGQNTAWDDTGLPADERDPDTDRANAKVRLILDAEDMGNTGTLSPLFLYGFVQQYQTRRVAPTQQERILWTVSFVPASIVIGGVS